MNKVEVFSLEAKFRKLERIVKTAVLKTFKFFNKKKSAVEIFLAGDNLMESLNYKFRNKKYPADVLSFPEPGDFLCFNGHKRQKIGEIFLNAAGLSRVAKKWGLVEPAKVNELAALKKLLIHGLLHLLGYTHYKRNDRIKMERLENKLLLNV